MRVVTVYTFGFDVAVTSEAVEHAASKHTAAATVNHRKVRKETGVDMGAGARRSTRIEQHRRHYARSIAGDHAPFGEHI
ncbi:hypothetical protein, partial [Burkholderia sp. BCCCDS15]|uniref:hypothetical protein n=1 Tax=Burkholderia sp. BCCCDS15 TaxID=3390242 RepID=UPI003D2EF952